MTRVQETARRSAEDRAELRRLDARLRHADRLVADSRAMQAACDLALRYAAVDSPVLLLGETGSGKGVLARLIHDASARRDGPLLEVNCGAIPAPLMEAELFGYARGAFTGADPRGKAGLVELAHGGTLFLDEIGDLPVALQVKLLRFLEDGEIWPVGGVRGKRPDVRIVAATNRDLAAMLADGGFRRDLYYRLNVLAIDIPPLRARREDIPGLVDMMLARLERKLARPVRLAPTALAALGRYPWPGNVRELWNLVERLAVTARGDTVEVDDLPREVRQAAAAPAAAGRSALRRAVQELEATMVREALARFGTQERAAHHLGVGQATVARKARRYGLMR
jgi:transcriptional regulator with PAS, ATPase and Fis domain